MKRDYFLETSRLYFSIWKKEDIEIATSLWGDENVTKFICATGKFSIDDIHKRLYTEIENFNNYNIQYWPIFDKNSNELVGCCGLRPYRENVYEIGFHIKPSFWKQGLAKEAAEAVIYHAFHTLKASSLFAGHNPNNIASRELIKKLGFTYLGDEFYKPTGLYHPSYELKNEDI